MTRAETLAVVVVRLALGQASAAPAAPAELVHGWTQREWRLPTEAAARTYRQHRVFERARLAGVDGDRNDNLYVSTPRWRDARAG